MDGRCTESGTGVRLEGGGAARGEEPARPLTENADFAPQQVIRERTAGASDRLR